VTFGAWGTSKRGAGVGQKGNQRSKMKSWRRVYAGREEEKRWGSKTRGPWKSHFVANRRFMRQRAFGQ